MKRPARPKLRTVNNWLTVVVVALAIYVIGMPFIPALNWWARHEAPLISHPASVATPGAGSPAIPKDNTLVIPNLGLQEIIHEGSGVHTLHFGVWHLPDTSSPDKGGNMVMAGHRYTYSGSGVFYHLDLVKTGDPIVLYWQHKRYNYTVIKTEVVPPTEVSVQAPSKDAHLTIYTCTPMWTFKNRLVILAQPEAQS
jgi:LPXTG-site transpeptidase (sortase) family protein